MKIAPANEIIKETISSLSSIEAWNQAMDFSIEIIREVLREEGSSLTETAASDIQRLLHQQKLFD